MASPIIVIQPTDYIRYSRADINQNFALLYTIAEGLSSNINSKHFGIRNYADTENIGALGNGGTLGKFTTNDTVLYGKNNLYLYNENSDGGATYIKLTGSNGASAGSIYLNTVNGEIGLGTGVVRITSTTDATDATGMTGALGVIGGLSVAKTVYINKKLYINEGTSSFVSTYRSGASDGNNIWIGTGGQSSTGSYSYEGTGNYSLGQGALQNITKGTGNEAIGHNAGYNITTGLWNVAIGRNALFSGSSIWGGAAIGEYALYNATGSYNIGLGTLAGFGITTGIYNIAIGSRSMYFSSGSANNNIAIGNFAGYRALGNGSVYIGHFAGSNNTTPDSFFLDTRSRDNVSDDRTKSLMHGVFANEPQQQTLRVNASLSAAGIFTALDVTDATDATGDSGSLRVRGGASIAKRLYSGSDAYINNVRVGRGSALSTGLGTNNTVVGRSALMFNSVGDFNTAIGTYSLSACDGSYNTAIGAQSLSGNRSSSYNTAVGAHAMATLTSGDDNVAIGYASQRNANGGFWNTTIGYFTAPAVSGYGNTVIGHAAGESLNTALQNTFIGQSAGKNVQNGSDNIAIGYLALQGSSLKSSPSRNIAIGTLASFQTTGTDNIHIGYYAGRYYTGSNTLYIDSISRSSSTYDTTALIVGKFHTNAALQTLRFNASLSALGTFTVEATDDATAATGLVGSIRTMGGISVSKTLYTGLDSYINNVRIGRGAGSGIRSTAIGIEALNNITTGDYNTALGYGALSGVTNRSYNIGIGPFALANYTGVNNSIAIGYESQRYGNGYRNITIGNNTATLLSGYNNVIIGDNAGQGVKTGNGNIYIGAFTGNVAPSGIENVAVGAASLFSFHGSYNVGIGTSTLVYTLGDSNVAIGYGAGRYETGSNTFYINNQDRITLENDRSKSLMYGTFNNDESLQTLRFNASLSALGSLTILNTTNATDISGTVGSLITKGGLSVSKTGWFGEGVKIYGTSINSSTSSDAPLQIYSTAGTGASAPQGVYITLTDETSSNAANGVRGLVLNITSNRTSNSVRSIYGINNNLSIQGGVFGGSTGYGINSTITAGYTTGAISFSIIGVRGASTYTGLSGTTITRVVGGEFQGNHNSTGSSVETIGVRVPEGTGGSSGGSPARIQGDFGKLTCNSSFTLSGYGIRIGDVTGALLINSAITTGLGSIRFGDTTDATDTTGMTGALGVIGGISVGKNGYFGGDVVINGDIQLGNTFQSASLSASGYITLKDDTGTTYRILATTV